MEDSLDPLVRKEEMAGNLKVGKDERNRQYRNDSYSQNRQKMREKGSTEMTNIPIIGEDHRNDSIKITVIPKIGLGEEKKDGIIDVLKE